MDAQWQAELFELLRIPSVSTDPARANDVRAAARWVAAAIGRAGGTAQISDASGSPIVTGAVKSNVRNAPTVLCYGHVDVQPPDPIGLWDSPPFEPEIRGDWLYARGAADDKGQLWMLLKAAELLAAEQALPVNLRFLIDGEEEIGGTTAAELVAADARPADACVIFDTGMLGRGRPVFNLATRGTAYFRLRVTTGARDLHSGVFGGAALNAAHVLNDALAALLPRDGRLTDELREGIAPPSQAELEAWGRLEPGADLLAAQGARPADRKAAGDFHLRTWAEPALDVHSLQAGAPGLMKTIVPAQAEAMLSMRLAPGQSLEQIVPSIERIVRNAVPAQADVELELLASCDPGSFYPRAPALGLAADAFERALGVRPLFVRSGGSLPIVPALAGRGIATVVTGFDLPDGNIHAPNERLLVEHVESGVAAARELFVAWGQLPRGD
jgi:acetylornithine deacetylase/succinyl-diaminopimelate desuccinylase-like protein